MTTGVKAHLEIQVIMDSGEHATLPLDLYARGDGTWTGADEMAYAGATAYVQVIVTPVSQGTPVATRLKQIHLLRTGIVRP